MYHCTKRKKHYGTWKGGETLMKTAATPGVCGCLLGGGCLLQRERGVCSKGRLVPGLCLVLGGAWSWWVPAPAMVPGSGGCLLRGVSGLGGVWYRGCLLHCHLYLLCVH